MRVRSITARAWLAGALLALAGSARAQAGTPAPSAGSAPPPVSTAGQQAGPDRAPPPTRAPAPTPSTPSPVEPTPAADATPAAEPAPGSTAEPQRAPVFSAVPRVPAPANKPGSSLDSPQRTSNAPELRGAAVRVIGLRGALGGRDGSVHGGAGLYERGIGVLSHELLTARYLDFAEIGGDSAGVRYRLEGQLAAGPQLRYLPAHSLFARLGLRARLARSLAVQDADLRLPELQIGHHSLGPHFQLDLAAHGSYLLRGQVIAHAPKLSVGGGWAFGAYASAALERVRLDAEWSRARSDTTRVDDARASLCLLWAQGMACADARLLETRDTHSSSRSHHALFFGLSALLGQVEWL